MRRLRSSLAAVTLATVLVPGLAAAQNIALNQPTFASSIYTSSTTPDKAVDGDRTGSYYGSNTIFHSANSSSDWWYVDLGQSYDISQIDFWNRTDCCSYRIIGATLGIFTATPYGAGGPAPIWSTTFPDGSAHQVFLPGATGQFIGIQAHATGDAYLQIAELEAQGTPSVSGPTTTTPEPMTWSLVAGGLLAIGAARRRRGARVG